MSRKWWVLASVACGTFMATLDSSIVNIALPTLTKELSADLYRIKWVVIVYLLVVTVLLLPFGRLSDEFGRKRVFSLGYLVFVVGSALCGLSTDLGMLVLFRGLQAIGASMLMVNGPAIITAVFPSTERGAALGTLAMVVSVGLISGPSIGGLLISEFGWRSIFWVNIPVGLLGVLLVYRNVNRDPMSRSRAPFDWVGAFLQFALLLSFIMLFDPPRVSVSGAEPAMVPRWVIGIITFVLGGVFLKVEADAKAPLFDLSLLKNRTFWTGNLASYLLFVSFSSVSVLMPFFLEEVLAFPPHRAGLFMTAVPLMIFVTAPISGRLSDRLGSQELSFAGAMVGGLGLLAMGGAFGLGLTKDVSHAGIILALSSVGLAMGLFQSPNNNSIMGAVPPSKLGVASALLATIRNLGMVTGTGLATGLFTWRMDTSGDFVTSLHTTHVVAGLLCFGAMIASLGKERGPAKAMLGTQES
ncbi:MAG: MFS transporter [Oligoflexia bacterium]|nr:MFS transporter [Oligoflexia bacterium]